MPSGLVGSGRTTKSVKRKRASPKACLPRKATKLIPSESMDSSIQPKGGLSLTAEKSRQKTAGRTKLASGSRGCIDVAGEPSLSKKQSSLDEQEARRVDSLLLSSVHDSETSESASSHSQGSEEMVDHQVMEWYDECPKRVLTLLDSMCGDDSEVILSSLEEFNDMLNMSGDEFLFMIPIGRVFSVMFAFMTPSTPTSHALFAARILSILLDPSTPSHIHVSPAMIEAVCWHISNVVLLDLSDQCVTVLSRLTRVPNVAKNSAVVEIVLASMHFYCPATQEHCLDIALDLLSDTSSNETVANLLIELLVHSDPVIVRKAAQGVRALGAVGLPGVQRITSFFPVLPEQPCLYLVEALTNWIRKDAAIGVWLSESSQFVEFVCTMIGREICRSVFRLIVATLPQLTIQKGLVRPLTKVDSGLLNAIMPAVERVYTKYPDMVAAFAVYFFLCTDEKKSSFRSLVATRVLQRHQQVPPALVLGALSVGNITMARNVLAEVKKNNTKKSGWKSLIGKQARLVCECPGSTMNLNQLGKQIDSIATKEAADGLMRKLVNLLEDKLLNDFDFSKLNAKFSQLITRPVRVALVRNGIPTLLKVEPLTTVASLKQFAASFPDEDTYWEEAELDEEGLADVTICKDGQPLRADATLLEVFAKDVALWDELGRGNHNGTEVDFWPLVKESPFLETIWSKTHELVVTDGIAEEQMDTLDDELIGLIKKIHLKFSMTHVSERLSQFVAEVFSLPVFLATRQFPSWTMQLPFLLSVEARRELMVGTFFGTCRSLGPRLSASERSLLPQVRQKIKLNRARPVESAAVLLNSYASQVEAVLEMEFQNEEGTGSGPTNEFYAIVAEALQNDSTVFRTCTDGSLFPQIGSTPAKWRLLGHLVGRALLDGRLVSLDLSPIFWEQVKGVSRSHLLEEIDNRLANSLEAMRGMGDEDIAQLELDKMPGCESIRFAKNLSVDAFIETVTLTTLHAEVQVAAFREAFAEVLPLAVLKLWEGEEISSLLAGSSNKEHWKHDHLMAHIHTAHGYTRKSDTFGWFIGIIESLTEEEKTKFIKFVTGSKSLPLGGFAGLKPSLTVVRVQTQEGNVDAILPSVMTCANFVKLPEYTSAEIMRSQVLRAISEGQGSFLLS